MSLRHGGWNRFHSVQGVDTSQPPISVRRERTTLQSADHVVVHDSGRSTPGQRPRNGPHARNTRHGGVRDMTPTPARKALDAVGCCVLASSRPIDLLAYPLYRRIFVGNRRRAHETYSLTNYSSESAASRILSGLRARSKPDDRSHPRRFYRYPTVSSVLSEAG